ncbi:MAG TPA: MxaK protein [Ramlibacter sp.]|uniref:MxaK protein n=1 Tax=Ramlibacter sp. TaxID=1917967 RepID=UPI002D7E4024|nr:MxaK protein [Ramlibacter sp.]HET8747684.1 MxaK protein [Ramlibacter sp.]
MRRRRIVHLVFALACLGLAVPVALEAWRLAQAQRINRAIAEAAEPTAADGDLPEARFAHALALARGGRYDPALAAYKALAQRERGPLGPAALYNLGNLHLREALKEGPARATESLPLVELAKQAYRDALRADPADWDARYNLERALGLAPEADESASADQDLDVQRERAITTAPLMRSDLP